MGECGEDRFQAVSCDQEPGLDGIAVIGVGCRFPGGVDSVAGYWSLLLRGETTAGNLPVERWRAYESHPENARALRHTTQRGSFLKGVEDFDAEFFGITPREAELMDPQQRILLEVTWEALEHAGMPTRALAGSDTGVFIGVGSDDYGRRMLEDLPRIEAWTGIGAAFCAVANRISYILDLRGPSLAVDTACSASLVAFHLACQSLRSGECPLAVSGGVNVIAGPGLTMVLDAAGAISRDGTCKSFDAAADGYGRGEGAGVLVLKRLADARRDGDRVLAVVLGSAVHQDGRTDGIMAPSQEAQTHLLRQTYRNAGIDPLSVDYVEAHGTGTPTGDPIEVGAIAAVLGTGRPPGQPCLIGSVKPNIGHLEAGAGAASLIKTVLSLQRGQIPPSVNVSQLAPLVPWDSSGLRVVMDRMPWPDRGRPRRAGVSGYGYGGTIAHVILQQGLESAGITDHGKAGRDQDQEKPRVYPISAMTEEGLRSSASRLAAWLEDAEIAPRLDSLAHTLARRRSHLRARAAVVAAGRNELSRCLRGLAEGRTEEGVASGRVQTAPAAPVWVFSGHGSQWAGMGRELLRSEPAFAGVIDRIEPVFVEELGLSPRRVIGADELGDVARIQPMIFALQTALAAVWRSHGLQPGAVIGHSVGEIAAAVTAGVFDLEEGARLVCRRSALLRRAAGKGAMAMVALPFSETVRQLGHRTDLVAAIAASPISTVVSGDPEAVATASSQWQAEGITVRSVATDVAFHSCHMDPLLDDLAAALRDLVPRRPTTPLYSTALENPRGDDLRDNAYWVANLRHPVRFAQAVAAATEDGYRRFVEISAHPVVAHSIDETLAEIGIEDGFVAHTMRRHQPELATFLMNLAALHCHGVELDWSLVQPEGELVDIPTMAWQHKRYWYEGGAANVEHASGHDVDSHTLLGTRLLVAGATATRLWSTYLDRDSRPYPGDHPVLGVEIVPACVLLNSFFEAGREGGERPELTDVQLRVPVVVSSARQLQIVSQTGSLRVSSRLVNGSEEDDRDQSWLTHTMAQVSRGTHRAEGVISALEVLSRCPERLDPGFVVERLASVGVAAMGFSWSIEELHTGTGELFAQVLVGESPDHPPTSWASTLDATMSMASVVFSGPPALRMPAHIREVAVYGEAPARVLIHVRATRDDAGSNSTVDIDVANLDGHVIARFSGLRYGRLEGDPGAMPSPRRLVHELAWRSLKVAPDSTAEVSSPSLAVFVGDEELARRLGERWEARGTRWLHLPAPEGLRELGDQLASAAVLVAPSRACPGEAIFTASSMLLRTTQVLASASPAFQGRLWCLTRGVMETEVESALGEASLWGLGRIVGSEHPEIWGGIVDLPGTQPETAAAKLLDLLRSAAGQDIRVLRGDELLIPRLVTVASPPTQPALECRPDGTYLVTGGLGILGLEVAAWLASRGARRLILAGRTALPPREQWDAPVDQLTRHRIEAVRSLERLGVTVRVMAMDIADREQVAALLTPAKYDMPPIRGIVHAAGVLDNRMVAVVDEESLKTVMRPKALGALVLHDLFPPGSLDFMVLFSSCGLLLGLTGQASYAAANSVLDALAWHRARLGARDTFSFAWTSWRGLGMSTSSEVIDAELAARGTADISADDAFRCWDFASRQGPGYYAVLRTVPLQPGASRPSLLQELVPGDQGAEDGEARVGQWAHLSGPDLLEYVISEVRDHVAEEVRIEPRDLNVHLPLVEMGVDSVMTLVIRRRMQNAFGLNLPANLLWHAPTVKGLAEYLAERIAPSPGAVATT
jgi:6-methylsalicylic acid synthase